MHFGSDTSGRSPQGRSLLGRGAPASRKRLRLTWSQVIFATCFVLSAVILFGGTFYIQKLAPLESLDEDNAKAPASATSAGPSYTEEPLLVSYAYYEKDPIQKANFEFFLQAGWHQPALGRQLVTWVFTVSGAACSPCNTWFPLYTELEPMPELGASKVRAVEEPPNELIAGPGEPLPPARPVAEAWAGARTFLLWRSENVGMDLACHNVTMEVLAARGLLWKHKYFFFINSSTRGPLYPAYMPRTWHWTHAFLERFGPLQGRHLAPGADVHAVASALVCLPDLDAGGPGPRLESWALALDTQALELLTSKGVFNLRACKTCSDAEHSIVVGGEYGITVNLLRAGLNVATLMARYARDLDWRDSRHWGCNDNVHASRHGTYDGIAFHPFETVFVKSSWHVADPYTRRYTTWVTQHLEGDAGTDGELNLELYRYAISDEALQPNLLEAAYNVTRVRQVMARQKDQVAQELAEEQRMQAAHAATLDV